MKEFEESLKKDEASKTKFLEQRTQLLEVLTNKGRVQKRDIDEHVQVRNAKFQRKFATGLMYRKVMTSSSQRGGGDC